MIVKNVLVCDDIRKELGNKISLMGIYGSKINISVPKDRPKDAPILLPLAFLICIENDQLAIDLKDFTVQISISLGEKKQLDVNATLASTEMEHIFNLPVPRFQLQITEATTLSVHVQIMKTDSLVFESTTIIKINVNEQT